VKGELVKILREHKGEENAITAREIADLIGVIDAEGRPVTRKLIRDYIKSEGLPVGACTKGYYWLSNKDELAKYHYSLVMRAEEILQRAKIVQENYFAHNL